jgi:hypothetical protein
MYQINHFAMSMTRYKLENQNIRVLTVLHFSEFVEPEGAVHIQQIRRILLSVESLGACRR